MKNLIIDGNKFDSIHGFYESILLSFPMRKGAFGKNLDALYDILSEESYESIRVVWYQKIRFELGDEFFRDLSEILFELTLEKALIFEV